MPTPVLTPPTLLVSPAVPAPDDDDDAVAAAPELLLPAPTTVGAPPQASTAMNTGTEAIVRRIGVTARYDPTMVPSIARARAHVIHVASPPGSHAPPSTTQTAPVT